MILYQDFSSRYDTSKNMTDREHLLFSPNIYIENLRIILVRNHWTDFSITLQKCSFGDPLPRLFKLSCYFKKHGAMGQSLFSFFIYIENFKNLLVRHHWADFNITWKECSFCDPLSSNHDSSKKRVLGGGAYFPYISI